MSDALLSVEALQAGYNGIQVLHGIDLEVREREVVAVLGSNGAGKSTLNNNVCGLFRATGGRVRLAGHDITGAAAARLVADGLVQVPEGRRIFPNLSVRENLELGG